MDDAADEALSTVQHAIEVRDYTSGCITLCKQTLILYRRSMSPMPSKRVQPP